MNEMQPINENEEYDVNDFVVAEIVNSLVSVHTDKTNRVCVMKKDKNNKIFYDIVSGMPFIPYELLFKDNYIYTVGARLPLNFYFPNQEKTFGTRVIFCILTILEIYFKI